MRKHSRQNDIHFCVRDPVVSSLPKTASLSGLSSSTTDSLLSYSSFTLAISSLNPRTSGTTTTTTTSSSSSSSSSSPPSAMATTIASLTDYSKTQRILLLIDLTPFSHLQNPTPYLTSLLSAAKTLSSFPPFSSSSAAAATLFSFKPFFSSLSPILSSSKLPSSFSSLSPFNLPSPAFLSLSTTLPSLLPAATSAASSFPSAPLLAASLLQLLHDYNWDSDSYDSPPLPSTLENFDSFSVSASIVKPNLVILFSPFLRSLNFASKFLGVELNDECLIDLGGFRERFCGYFDGVKEVFCGRGIHLSWVDVKCELGSCDSAESEKLGLFFESGIRDLGWGFCSSDSVVLGSALVPFGLIYPKIGIPPEYVDFGGDCQVICHSQLNLEIVDVSGKPLECKCCDLELANLNVFPANSRKVGSLQMPNHEGKEMVWGDFRDGVAKLQVKAVTKIDKCGKYGRFLLDPVIVHEVSGAADKDQKEGSSEFFEDRVLKILGTEMGGLAPRKSVPIWQILLSFLYREGFWALVSISNGNGKSITGLLKPFTVFSALLSIVSDESRFDQLVRKADTVLISDKHRDIGGGKRKNKKNIDVLQELTWSAFCKAASEDFQVDLEDAYFTREPHNSKKLRFLKCWMKQIQKSSCSLTVPDRSLPLEDTPKEVVNRLIEIPLESEQPIPSSASAAEDSLTGASRVQDDVALDICSGDMETFFADLPHKIQQGLESEDVDLASLAERLVNSCIYWLYQKGEKETVSEGQTPAGESGSDRANAVALELVKLLLRESKDLAAICKSRSPSEASNRDSLTAANTVREYELQILFRMEILQSEAGESIEEPTKQKLVKQICSLLETIQCHLEGGFFSDWSLDKYVGKIIKSRYCHSLGDVVHRIYQRMDLLLFADEDEAPDPLLDSEESSQSWSRKIARDEKDEIHRNNDPVSTEDESLQVGENECQNPQRRSWEEHARKLTEAREKRQRARRFSSFTTWVPDLQRVWAPKQPKSTRPKADHLYKLSKRKDEERVTYDMVCETPMTGNKRSCKGGSSSGKDCPAYGTQFSGSVSKALFRDD